METPKEILKANPLLDSAIDCIIYKTHPVIKFHKLNKHANKNIFEIEAMFRGAKVEVERDRLFESSPDYALFENQVKQCLMGMEKFCRAYNIDFD